MSTILDLEAQIDGLRGLKADLEEYYWSAAGAEGPHEAVHAVGIVIAQLTQRTGALEDLLRHHGATTVRIDGLALQEAGAVERATSLLDRELVLPPGAPSATHWARLRAVLSAVDDVLVAALRATPESPELPNGLERRSHPGVVLSLARSAK